MILIKKICVLNFVLLLIFSFQELNAQQNQLNTRDIQSQQSQQTTNVKVNADIPDLMTALKNLPVPTTLALEGAINPDKYIIGPNDLFLLGIYGFVNSQVQLLVNPEGSVIIPSVGEINVNKMSITNAREKVIKACKKRYYSSDISFTLQTPRNFLVIIDGLYQGIALSTPVTRASDLIKSIVFDTLNVSRVAYEKTSNMEYEKTYFRTHISMRNMLLIRKDGSQQKIDLYKYYITRDDKYNPFLLDGDVIKISNTLVDQNYITVLGAVQLGGLYEYSEDDDLETAIGLGRGFDVQADKDSITVYRPRKNSSIVDSYKLSFDKDKNFKIEIYDRIYVKYKSDYQKMATVLILGEVESPGYYPVTYKNTRIRDVINLAGGFKKTAYLPLSILFRNWDAEYSSKDTMEYYFNKRANDILITSNDRDNYRIDLQARRNRVIIDFNKLINNDESQNVILEDKDIIYINDNKNIVYVYGQVNNEGYVPYESGKDYNYYIEKAGGYGLAADESNTRIIKFNTRGWYKAESAVVQNGDFIYVPKIDKKPFSENITVISQIASVLLGIISTYLLIKSTSK